MTEYGKVIVKYTTTTNRDFQSSWNIIITVYEHAVTETVTGYNDSGRQYNYPIEEQEERVIHRDITICE